MQTDFGGCFQEFAKAGTLMVTLSSFSECYLGSGVLPVEKCTIYTHAAPFR
ncbi:hypothetical protein YC2023_083895 [Brassica napus]